MSSSPPSEASHEAEPSDAPPPAGVVAAGPPAAAGLVGGGSGSNGLEDSPTWLERVKTLLGPRGYDHSMRRSIQTLVIYEAKRCIQPRIGDLRPFQRKVALVDQAQALVNMLDFCLPHHKAEILWRTSTSRETVTPEICWKRHQLVQKELDRLCEQVKQFMAPERNHQEAVDLLEQHLFECSGDNQGKPNAGKLVPPNWGHAHNHVLLCFRLYYKGDSLDPEFPAPIPPKNIVVPAIMPKTETGGLSGGGGGSSEKASSSRSASAVKHHHNHLPLDGESESGLLTNLLPRSRAAIASSFVPTASPAAPPNPSDERRRLLHEVREHLDLLKEFEDVAPEEELEERKRKLYAALPPAPPPYSNKRQRH